MNGSSCKYNSHMTYSLLQRGYPNKNFFFFRMSTISNTITKQKKILSRLIVERNVNTLYKDNQLHKMVGILALHQ